jgi:phosphatidylglycerol lysyltransferase
VLIATASQYRIRSSNKWMQTGLKTSLISFAAVMFFGYISFYYIDVKHFGVDFTWKESLVHTFNIFLLTEDSTLNPITHFGHEFVVIIRVLGFLTWGFLLFTLIKPFRIIHTSDESSAEKAKSLLNEFGNSAVDYYKLYRDKLHFFSDIHQAFVAYRIADNFAIVLEEPVCDEENKIEVLIEFEKQCRKMGLKTAYYRVDENSTPWFNQLKKQKLIIGQEAILEVDKFGLEGKDKKSLRNGLNSLQKKGCVVDIYPAPHSATFIDQLKKVSDEWLVYYDKEEMLFSQGMFDEKELQQQDIIAVTDEAGNVQAFLNIIPDFAEDECTYDMIRKTADAPAASMDALIVKMVDYAKERNKLFINLGMVAMSGIAEPNNTAEQIIKLVAEKIKRFQHYKGLREFKEKYATLWENKYLVYENDFDLIQLPGALNKIMKA